MSSADLITFKKPANGFRSRRHFPKVYLSSAEISKYKRGYKTIINTYDGRIIKAYSDVNPDFSSSEVWFLRSTYIKIVLLSRPNWARIELQKWLK